MPNFGKTVADRLLCAKYPAAAGFPLIAVLRGGAGESAVYKGTWYHWHECALVSVCACSCAYACVNENVREKECYEEMNERNDIYI